MTNFEETINTWITSLSNLDLNALTTKSSAASWSMGQLYQHLINDTNFYIEQVKACLTSNENSDEEAAPFAKQLFQNNAFPDMQIEGAASNALIPQPASKEKLLAELGMIKLELNHLLIKVRQSEYNGKTQHPGLGYFNAEEWLQFTDIHFRHHLKQKNKIEAFLQAMSFTK